MANDLERCIHLRDGKIVDCTLDEFLADLNRFAVRSDTASWYCAMAADKIREARAQIESLKGDKAVLLACDADKVTHLEAQLREARAALAEDARPQPQMERWGRYLSEIRQILGRDELTFDELPNALRALRKAPSA